MSLNLNNGNQLVRSALLLAVMVLLIAGCAAQSVRPYPDEPPPEQTPEELPEPESRRIPPQMLAAAELTVQGREQLRNGRYEQAIRTFERALNVHPGHGPTYYYLAEAWLKTGNLTQAKTFNRQAHTYLKNHSGWLRKILDQKRRIAHPRM